MAAAIITYDHEKDPMRAVVRGLQMIREGVETLTHARAVMIQACDGATNVAANWAALTAMGTFQAGGYADANTATMAAFAEIDSVYGKLTAPAGQGDATGAAISQACGKLGIAL